MPWTNRASVARKGRNPMYDNTTQEHNIDVTDRDQPTLTRLTLATAIAGAVFYLLWGILHIQAGIDHGAGKDLSRFILYLLRGGGNYHHRVGPRMANFEFQGVEVLLLAGIGHSRSDRCQFHNLHHRPRLHEALAGLAGPRRVGHRVGFLDMVICVAKPSRPSATALRGRPYRNSICGPVKPMHRPGEG